MIYTAVGFVENVSSVYRMMLDRLLTTASQIVPTYQSEVSPAALRGFFVGAIDLFLLIGALIAALVNNALSSWTTQEGWILATALQALPPVVILIGLPFTPGKCAVLG